RPHRSVRESPVSVAAEFNNVSKVYAGGLLRRHAVQALREVSLRVEAGEGLGLRGPSRAGKTPLAKVLRARCRPDAGEVRRRGPVQALGNDPGLVVLDEPAEGVDLGGRQLLRGVVRDLKARGRTVVLISHVLTEVEQLCDRVAVLVAGRLVHAGPVAELTRGA